jgi:hypothetical protein
MPIACLLCGGARLQALLHAHDRKRKVPRWDYHVVRCAGCGLLFRHPGIRPERLGDLYSSATTLGSSPASTPVSGSAATG